MRVLELRTPQNSKRHKAGGTVLKSGVVNEIFAH